MRRFSLQHPKRSSWINEWILHQWYKYEDLVYLRYKYVKVYINGKNHGVYALEESFDKELIENNHRREGPILKFDESALHDGSRWNSSTVLNQTDIFFNSNIKAFRYSKIKSDSLLFNQFLVGKKLLSDFRSGIISASDAFDLKKVAKLYAITNIADSPHSLRWKNVRFYYNPIINKLELIGYNAYDAQNEVLSQGNMSLKNYTQRFMIDEFHDIFFNDNNFIKYYTKYLRQMSNKKYLDDFFMFIEEELSINISKIHSEFPRYYFSKKHRYLSQEKVNNFLEPKIPFILRVTLSNDILEKNSELTISNNSFLPIKINSFILTNENKNIMVDKVLKAKIPNQNLYYENIEYDFDKGMGIKDILKNGIIINYHVLGLPEELKSFKILEEDISIEKQLGNLIQASKFFNHNYDFIDYVGDSCFIKQGDWIIDESLVIPSGLKVIMGPKTKLDLINHSKIISYSPIYFEGTADDPIIIKSSDQTGQGLICIDAGANSKLSYVIFDRLSNPDLDGWQLTGSVNFYESKIDISDCIFSNNYCEDALNIIRTSFTINNTKFVNIFSDAFDGDFANGKITNSIFNNVVNDAIDISGGLLEADKIKIYNVGDKGFSAGENSNFIISNSEIDSANIGIASKDLSFVHIENLSINNTEIAFAAFQKKPEFGPGSIEVKKVEIGQSVKRFSLIEKNSYIIHGGKKLKSNTIDARDLLYGN